MHYVYVIRSLKTQQLYFGKTANLDERLEAHNQGRNTSTKNGRPWEYLYCEGYKDDRDATVRELKLKHYGNARTHVKKRLKHGIQ